MHKGRKEVYNHSRKKITKYGVAFRLLYIFLLVVIALVSFSIGGVFAYKDYLLNLPSYISDDSNATMVNEEGSVVNISQVIASETTVIDIPEYEHIHNILLIGVDSRSRSYSTSGAGSRADVIMIMSVNEEESTIKLLSIARDSYAYIPGYSDPQKINGAMTYGGADLLMATVERSLRIELDEYAFVNFYHMEKVINAIGGVYVHVSEAERTEPGGLNSIISSSNREREIDENTDIVQQAGTQRLNGRQAVAYSRIRYVGNGDYGRSLRQVEVMQSLLTQFTKRSVKQQVSAIENILPHVATNIEQEQIEWYAFGFLSKMESPELEYMKLPINEHCNQGYYSDFYKGQWSIRPDWNAMIPYVQEYIFGETFPVDPVRTIPGAPDDVEE